MNRIGKAMDQWRGEMPSLDLLPMEVVGLLKATTAIARTSLESFCREHGLQLGEFDVLATLRRAGAPYSLAPTQLFRDMMITSGGMTNRLDRLEKAGLIRRAPNPEDRRGTLVSLTPKGLDLITHVIPQHVDNEAALLSPLDRKEQEQLRALLGKLLAGLEGE